jgi:hypothetical protein
MKGPRRWLRFAPVLAALLCAAPALAQKAEANVLFDEGRSLMAKKDYAAASAKLEQSQQLDPAVGTLLNLGECYTALGRTASAWSAYRDAASLAATTKQTDRERYANQKARELDARLSRLELAVASPARVPGLTITRNGVLVPEGLWGAAIPVDPGTQHVEAKAPGYVAWSGDTLVDEGARTVHLEVPVLAAVRAAPAPTPPPAAAPSEAPGAMPTTISLPPSPPPAPSDRPEPSSQPLIGWLTIGSGAAVGGTGLVLYVLAQGKFSDSNCPNDVCVRGIGDKTLHDEGRTFEKLGGALMIAGGAALAIGSVVLLSAPEEPETAAERHLRWRVTASASGLDVRGSW